MYGEGSFQVTGRRCCSRRSHEMDFETCCHRLPTLSHLQCYTTDISDLPGSGVAPNQMGYTIARYQSTPENPQHNEASYVVFTNLETFGDRGHSL
jgi:hypothetical protein